MKLTRTSTLAAGLIALAGLVTAAPARLTKRSFDYSTEKLRGVNIGGWLVLEPWITPSLFEQFPDYGGDSPTVDEYTFCKTLGSDEAYKQLQQHWQSWITYDDFKALADAGVNTVRIPIGYWAFALWNDDPYVQGQQAYLDNALAWAEELGLNVMIDLHGAPGSQNGFDNSGQRGNINWLEEDTLTLTVKVIDELASKYANHPAVTSIELLNEPLGASLNMTVIKQFYEAGYGTIRQYSSDVDVVIHDAYVGLIEWEGFMNAPDYADVVLDTHIYQVFNNWQLELSLEDHVQAACTQSDSIGLSNQKLWTIVGEFSGAMTDCARWLNGFGIGARYDGTYYKGSSWIGSCDGESNVNSASQLTADKRANIRQFIEAQLDAYETGAGWIFWTAKTEAAPEWNFIDLVNNGVMPQPLTERWYGQQCS
ncbi:hypothetical protein YB2330_005228 [Saitoella coloradoensis]